MIDKLFEVPGGWWPRFSPDGARVCFGNWRTGYALTLKNAATSWIVPDGHPGGWFSPTVIYFLREGATPGLWRFDLTTMQPTLIDATVTASSFDVVEGHWAAARHFRGHLLYDGRLLESAHRLGVSLWRDHLVNSRNPGVETNRWPYEHRINGVVVRDFTPPVGQTNDWRLGEDGWLGYGYFGRARVASPDDPPQFSDISVCPAPLAGVTSGESPPVVFRAQGALWVLTGCEVGADRFMALRPLGSRTAIKIPWPAVRPAVFAEANGTTVLVAGSSDRGHLAVFRVSLDHPQETITLPATLPPVVAPLGPCWVGYFFEVGRYGVYTAPSHCTVIVDPGFAAKTKEPVIISPGDNGHDLIGEFASTWHRVVAIYCAAEAEGTPQALQRVVDLARERMRARNLPQRPVLVYASTTVWPEVTADGWSVECYPAPGETLAQAEVRWRAQAKAVQAGKFQIALVTADYDRRRNADPTSALLTEATLLAAQPVYVKLARDLKPRYWLRFSYGRAGGTAVYPSLQPWHEAVVRATTAPPVQTLPPPQPPTPAPPAPVPPGVPIMTTLRLRTSSGKYVCAELDGSVTATREAAASWETFTVESHGDKIALKTAHGKYVCAEMGQGGMIVANRTQVGAWEKFTLHRLAGGAVALQADNGQFVCAEEGGGRELIANRAAIGLWETFNGPSSGGGGSTPGGPFEGPLTVEGRFMRAAGRIFRPRGVTAFFLPKLLVEGKHQQVEDYLGWATARGLNLFRVFLSGKGWNELRPDDGLAVLPDLLLRLRQRGCAAEVTVITGSRDFANGGFTNWEPIVRAAGDIAHAAGNAVIEIANEYPHGTQSGQIHEEANLRRWGRGLPVPWAIGAAKGGRGTTDSPNTDEPLPGVGYPGVGGTYATSHLDRGRPYWEQVRRVREIFGISEGTKAPAWDNERIGAAEFYSAGKRMNDPVFFLTAGVLNRCFETPAVHHTDKGLFCTVPGPVESACADAFVRGVRDVVPGDGELFYRNSSHAGSPVKEFTGATRCYSFVSGGRGVTVVIGGDSDTKITWWSGYRSEGILCDERATGPDSKNRRLIVHAVRA